MAAPDDELSLIRERTAVLVIECQNDLVHESHIGGRGLGAVLAAAVAERQVLPHIANVLQAARRSSVPVVYLNKESKAGVPTSNAPIYRLGRRIPLLVEGSWGAQVHPAIAPQPGDYVLPRFLSVDASYGSSLFGTLKALGRDTVVAMGVSTNFAVEGTVRGAVNRLVDVVVPEDCCASVPEDLHRFSIERILPLLAVVSSSAAVIAALDAGATA